ncbi:hypothetical protein M8542_46305 [Amycolatopsis sp. OK19-0408]|uniref:Uncharacterized protein n=1 Tax=Amycolatopsis iheyensis TaxID=2945988 RepID=A0A9X2NQ87_9PSEU|nr:hypothetical protein [Amycolatopsis iheyensis]MCR6490245.1 hypothetical protein [Amycolatopsis iheyensis]
MSADRSAGPPVVTAGDPSGAKVIVLDPAGAGNHGELPATWRPLARRRGIFWCRVPADGALTEADDLLGDRGRADPEIAVVAGGPLAAEALQLVGRHPGAAAHLLLVTPSGAGTDPSAELRAAGTDVRVVAPDAEEPLPLGHPDVVAAVRAALGDV